MNTEERVWQLLRDVSDNINHITNVFNKSAKSKYKNAIGMDYERDRKSILDGAYKEILSLMQEKDKRIEELENKINDWEYYLAYYTLEDIATPEGVINWVMSAFNKDSLRIDKLQSELTEIKERASDIERLEEVLIQANKETTSATERYGDYFYRLAQAISEEINR
jgi:hypothetical protein